MNGSAAGPGPKEESRGPGVAACAAALAGLAVVLGVAGRYVGLETLAKGGWAVKAAAVVSASLVATLVWAARGFLFRTLTSLRFAVALLALVLLATVLGTFVLQGAAPEEYARKYGNVLAPALVRLRLDDIFHSAWFAGWLALLALSLGLVAVRRRAWRPIQWGHGLSHLGVVLILAGGFIGSRWGMKGYIDLHEGQSAGTVVPAAKAGSAARPRPLGFSIRLEDFDIERRPPEYRLYVYEREGSSFRPLRSFGLKEVAAWIPAGSSGSEFRVVREFPDFRLRTELEEVPPGLGAPALRVEVDAAGHAIRLHLFAGAAGRDTADLAVWGGPLLRFAWDPPAEAEVARWPQPRPQRHIVAVKTEGDGPGQEVEVRIGGEASVAGIWSIRALAFYPDFVFDSETRQAASRSDQPNNPALQVAVSPAAGGPEERRWLFANVPEFGHMGARPQAGLPLVYRHDRAYVPAPKEILVVGKTGEAWELEGGCVLRRSPLVAGEGALPGLPGARARLWASARETHVPESRSAEWRNPAVEIEVRRGTEIRTDFLKTAHGQPLHLPDGKTVLAFEPKPDDIKAFRSRLAVLEGGRKVLEKAIEVNDPLSYGGYAFYQSNYRKQDPTYSGILVVRDPGLPLVWAGLVMICIGVIYIYYVRPRLWKGVPGGGAR